MAFGSFCSVSICHSHIHSPTSLFVLFLWVPLASKQKLGRLTFWLTGQIIFVPSDHDCFSRLVFARPSARLVHVGSIRNLCCQPLAPTKLRSFFIDQVAAKADVQPLAINSLFASASGCIKPQRSPAPASSLSSRTRLAFSSKLPVLSCCFFFHSC